MILLIPMAYPVYKRELGSHMYTPTPYYIAATVSNILTNMFYPLLVSTLTFWFFDYKVNNFAGYLGFLAVEATSALCGISFGQVIGSFVHTENAALIWLLQSLTIYYLGAGMLVNAATTNWLGTFLQWISPLRYINELGMRRMLAGRNDQVQDAVLERLGFTWGTTTCYVLAYMYFLGCLGLGLLLMNRLSRGT